MSPLTLSSVLFQEELVFGSRRAASEHLLLNIMRMLCVQGLFQRLLLIIIKMSIHGLCHDVLHCKSYAGVDRTGPQVAPFESMPCKSVLIVEDEVEIRENLMLLMELEGYPVHGAANGREALELLRKIPPPCLILLDLLMPVMTGTEFLEAMSREGSIASIPVCVVSAVAERPALPESVDFIKKPMEFDELLRCVQIHCGDPSSGDARETQQK